MAEQTTFEARLAAAFAAYADRAPLDVDAVGLTAAIARDGRPTSLTRSWRIRRIRPIALLAAALLGGLLIGGGIAVGSGLFRLPWTAQQVLVEPAAVEPCELLERALLRARLPQTLGPFHQTTEAWGGRVCAFGYDDGNWAPHVYFLPSRSSEDQARSRLIAVAGDFAGPGYSFSGWADDAPGVWIGTWTNPDRTHGAEFFAVAMFADPYFFVVTYRDRDGARRIAEAVIVELQAGT